MGHRASFSVVRLPLPLSLVRSYRSNRVNWLAFDQSSFAVLRLSLYAFGFMFLTYGCSSWSWSSRSRSRSRSLFVVGPISWKLESISYLMLRIRTRTRMRVSTSDLLPILDATRHSQELRRRRVAAFGACDEPVRLLTLTSGVCRQLESRVLPTGCCRRHFRLGATRAASSGANSSGRSARFNAIERDSSRFNRIQSNPARSRPIRLGSTEANSSFGGAKRSRAKPSRAKLRPVGPKRPKWSRLLAALWPKAPLAR